MADQRSPAQALKTYRDKRNFELTPEPAEGGVPNEAEPAFVIQKHWARRLHYDFRLELDGAMKSWAVPKGPSLDPADKRMAMPTEDHPIAYNTFEGTIPPGNYGAGEVIVWDRGSWHPIGDARQGMREGKLKFELRGQKLHGAWTLVRMKGRGEGREDPWLLIKERDDYARPAAEYNITEALPESVNAMTATPAPAATSAKSAKAAKTTRASKAKPATAPTAAASTTPAPGSPGGPPAGARPAPLPATLQPQLAVLAEAPPPDAGNWLYEIKFDGYRLLTRAEGGRLRLFTRNGNDWTDRLPELHAALEAMDLPDGWYDGEIILPGERNPADFQALQGAFKSGRTGQVVYYLFDLPWCAGHDLREVPQVQRREVLQRIIERKPQPTVRFSEEFDAPPEQVVATACQLGLEGVIAKRRAAHYVEQRSTDWLKLKCGLRQEFVIVGYTDPQGSRTGLGSLLLAVHGDDGQLRYAGNVGTGFSQATLKDLTAQLEALRADRSPLPDAKQVGGRPHWVRPELVAEVAFAEWTRDGRIRHSVFHGLRSDKPPEEVTQEEAVPAKRTRGKRAAAPAPATARAPAPAPGAELPPGMRLTNPDRVVDESTGLTKLDLARYYAQVATVMLPHLKDRPIAMVRAPAGLDGELFFQKHAERYTMAGIEPQPPELDPGQSPLLVVASAEGLLSAAQLNVIEFHTWNGTARAIDRPDRMTFDLDPGEGVAWPQVQEAAALVKALLEEIGLPAFLKTSGGKALHLVVPLQPAFDWDTVKAFSHAIVKHLARTLPDRFVAKSGPRNRVGRIFIDYLRNGYGATTVAAWSVRARPGLGISVPVRWDELPRLRHGAHWTVREVGERLPVGNTPWDDYEDRRCTRATVRAAMQALGFEPPRTAG